MNPAYGSMRERALQALRGEMPARLPFITRLETWFTAHRRTGTLPERFRDLSLDELHRATGVGRLKFSAAYGFRLVGVEVTAWLNGERIYRESQPVVENFPGMWDIVPTDRAGVTHTELATPAGKLTLTHQLLENHIRAGTDPYLMEHLLKDEGDYRTLEYILERVELVPFFDRLGAEEQQLGGHGLLVPLLQRIPFQQCLLEYLGEEGLFFTLHDEPRRVLRLLELLDRQLEEALDLLAGLDVPYVEFPDNLDGRMTNPRLFREHCLPAYQKYSWRLHAQGKLTGSHTDGNVRPLLGLLAQTGLDTCESFSPYPLTPCTFAEAAAAWQGRPLIWGGIPSLILEERTSEEDFERYLDELFASINQPLILGVVDLFMRHNAIERVEAIARRVEDFAPAVVPGGPR